MKKIVLVALVLLLSVQVASAITFNQLPTDVPNASVWYGYNSRAVEWDFATNSGSMVQNTTSPTGAPGATYDNALGPTNATYKGQDYFDVNTEAADNLVWSTGSGAISVGPAPGKQGHVLFHLGDTTNVRAVWVEVVVATSYSLQTLVGNSDTLANPLNVRATGQTEFAHGAATGAYTAWAQPAGGDLYIIDFWMVTNPGTAYTDILLGLNNSGGYYISVQSMKILTSAVPEPATMMLLGSGLLGLAGAAWRRRRQK